MAQWQKSSPELIALFDSIVPSEPSVEKRRMFGYPCVFVNGHMFAGLHENRLAVRIPALADQQPFVVLGRRMREYAAIEHPLDEQNAKLRAMMQDAFAYATTLPPKAAKVKAQTKVKAKRTP